ncbi:hypothetical protein DGG96_08435 [Legionella qingyii]|uniref:Uncharacterized protein n=1 Tax=Legionella qingyii TaxID=2184757 RepID=A0A317U703_9GAMM|nr:hypothetical protein DGG96_08435 [Legionella qingyii]
MGRFGRDNEVDVEDEDAVSVIVDLLYDFVDLVSVVDVMVFEVEVNYVVDDDRVLTGMDVRIQVSLLNRKDGVF